MQKRNKKWLESQKFYAEGHGEADALKKSKLISQGSPGSKGMVRKLSRRGIYNSITFTDENLIPGFLRDPEPLPVQPDNVSYFVNESVYILSDSNAYSTNFYY